MKAKSLVCKDNRVSTQIIVQIINQYLQQRPSLYSLIRPQESYLFYHYREYIREPILDFGHGDGFFASLLSNLIKKKYEIGLDLTESQIDQAKKYQLCRKLMKYDGRQIRILDQSFNSIISNCVFEHLEDLDFSLNELRRLLKPNGYLLTTVMSKVWEDTLLGNKVLGQSYQRFLRKKQVHYNLLSSNEWQNRFEKAGFKVLVVTGYLPVWLAHWLEFSHYTSVGNLVCYKLSKHWALPFPWYSPLDRFLALAINKALFCKPKSSAALFYLLQRK